ncbi:MFS transporter [Bacillus sp. BGMRC 2118]|nr:MFS transporter [Bacillus sp. BGMRC 2118]
MQTIYKYKEMFGFRNVRILTFVTFFYSLTFYTTIYTLFLKERGLSYFEIFLLESFLSAAIFIFEIPSGKLADKVGRKKLVTFSVFLYTISSFILAFSHHYFWFVVESILYGIGIAAMSGADSALIYDDLKREKKEKSADYAFSLTGAAVTAAMIVSLPVGGWLAEYSLELPLYVTCISLVIACALTFQLTEVEEVVNNAQKAKTTILSVFRQYPTLLLLQGVQSFSFGVVFSLVYLNQPLFIDYEIDIKYFGIIMLVVNGFTTVGLVCVPALREKLGQSVVLIVSTALPGVLLVSLSFFPPVTIGIIMFGFIQVFHSMKEPVYRSLINERISDENRATVLSIISFVGGIIGMIVKPLIGLLTDFSLYTTFMVLGIGMILASGLTGIIITKVKEEVQA